MRRSVVLRGTVLADIPQSIGVNEGARSKSADAAASKQTTVLSPAEQHLESLKSTDIMWIDAKKRKLEEYFRCSDPVSAATATARQNFQPTCAAGVVSYGPHLVKGNCLARLSTLRQVAGDETPVIVPRGSRGTPQWRGRSLLFSPLISTFAWIGNFSSRAGTASAGVGIPFRGALSRLARRLGTVIDFGS